MSSGLVSGRQKCDAVTEVDKLLFQADTTDWLAPE